MALDLGELRDLLAAINQTDIAELILKSDDFELTVRRGARADGQLQPADAISSQIGGAMTVPPMAQPSAPAAATSQIMPIGSAFEPPAIATAQPTPPPKSDRRLVEILSPMVGTFYRAPGPDEPAFVDVGDRIQVGQTVCIIEAMKLMNELEAEVTGEVTEILVQNGEPVEYGQPLMRVNPS